VKKPLFSFDLDRYKILKLNLVKFGNLFRFSSTFETVFGAFQNYDALFTMFN